MKTKEEMSKYVVSRYGREMDIRKLEQISLCDLRAVGTLDELYSLVAAQKSKKEVALEPKKENNTTVLDNIMKGKVWLELNGSVSPEVLLLVVKAADPNTLSTLIITNTNIREIQVAKEIAQLQALTSLNISHNKLDLLCAPGWLKALAKLPVLTALDISNNYIMDYSWNSEFDCYLRRDKAEIENYQPIGKRVMGNGKPLDDSVVTFEEASSYAIDFGKAIAALPKLIVLNNTHNALGRHALNFIKGLVNSKIQILDLSHNNLSEYALDCSKEIAKLPALTTLGASYNNLQIHEHDYCKRAQMKKPGFDSEKELAKSRNLDMQYALNIVQALAKSKSLTELVWRDPSEEIIQAVQEALSSEGKLKHSNQYDITINAKVVVEEYKGELYNNNIELVGQDASE